MATQNQLDANRRNAALSTGPRTDAGKAHSRQNALKHGLRAEAIAVLPNEDPDAFARRIEGWIRDFRRGSDAEAELIRQAATLSWKLDRADRHETAVLSRRVVEAVNACDCEDDDSGALNEAAAIASFDPSNEGERLRRYQFALLREMRRSLESILKLKKLPAPNEPNFCDVAAPNEPNFSELPAPNEPNSITEVAAPNEPNYDATVAVIGSSEPISEAFFPVSAGEAMVEEPHLISTNEANPTADGLAPNEPNSDAEVARAESRTPIAGDRRRRDRWPLETLKQKRRRARCQHRDGHG